MAVTGKMSIRQSGQKKGNSMRKTMVQEPMGHTKKEEERWAENQGVGRRSCGPGRLAEEEAGFSVQRCQEGAEAGSQPEEPS